MKKISRKIIVAGLAAVIGIGGLSGTVLAAGTYQPVSLNSYGVFSYDDGNANNNNGYKYDIFLDASDLTKLNDNLNVLKSDVDSCFQSVSNGKALLASTLTGLGVTTASDATFATINANITTLATNKYNEGVNAGKASVTVGGTASNANILKDKTITVNGTEKYKGTMPDNGATGASNLAAGESYTIPAGYTSGGTVTTKSLAEQTAGTATAADIKSGKTAWVGGSQITGTDTSAKVYDLGVGTSFDLTAYTGYGSFTENNFICEQLTGTVEANCGGYATESIQWPTASTSATVSKSYNASTGTLTASETITTRLYSEYTGTTTKKKSSTFSVHAYLIIN